jgi:hypothetical protein
VSAHDWATTETEDWDGFLHRPPLLVIELAAESTMRGLQWWISLNLNYLQSRDTVMITAKITSQANLAIVAFVARSPPLETR